MSTLVGIALYKETQFEINTRLRTIFPEENDAFETDMLKELITVKHLLTMTFGFDGDDDNDSSPGSEGRVMSKKNVYQYTLRVPIKYSRGTALFILVVV